MDDDTPVECNDCTEETTYGEADFEGLRIKCPECGGPMRRC